MAERHPRTAMEYLQGELATIVDHHNEEEKKEVRGKLSLDINRFYNFNHSVRIYHFFLWESPVSPTMTTCFSLFAQY